MEPLDAIEQTLIDSATDIRSLLHEQGGTVGTNPTGDSQRAADTAADELLCERLGALEGVGTYASEERESTIDVGSGLSLAVDPLDGSSNLPSNNPVGTIVSAFDASLPVGATALRAVWIVLYGPRTSMISLRNGDVTESFIHEGVVRTMDDVALPDDPTIYGVGGRAPDWPPAIEAFVVELRDELKLRYGGSMVADVSQVLSYGGLFAYPTLESAPQGKLRTQFEGIPIAAVIEAAGGASSTGDGSLLAAEPTSLHDRTPVYVGNDRYVERVEELLGEQSHR